MCTWDTISQRGVMYIWNNTNCCSFCGLNIHRYVDISMKLTPLPTTPPNTHLISNHKFSFRIISITFPSAIRITKNPISHTFSGVLCIWCVVLVHTESHIDLWLAVHRLLHVFTNKSVLRRKVLGRRRRGKNKSKSNLNFDMRKILTL